MSLSFPAKLTLMAVAAATLVGCAGTRDRGAPPPPGEQPSLETTQAATPAPQPGAPTEVEAAPPRPPGFWGRLARSLGSEADTPNAGPCPPVRILNEASRFVEISGQERFENVGFTGEINGTDSSCRYIGDDPITVRFTLDLALGKGPRAAGTSRDIVYWVAVTQVVRGTDPTTGEPVTVDVGPLVRERFTYRAEFPDGQTRIERETPVTTVTIPRARETVSGANFEVIVGFELTEDQLAFNRAGKRFRIDASAR